ncbi:MULTISPECIES: hypothetical protein [Massilia]|uniref:Uncharacterized protein n=1 Tax=Massilia haematophila TaxID=457923 RepID=A0ABV7PFN9_9BURK|nr:hypothetical protein [Massilia sp.]HBZ07628.1 hypothetical protein [Massilia sp.]
MKTKTLIATAIGVAALASATAVAMNYDKWFVFPAYHDAVASVFKDPDSTMFRNEKMPSPTVLCGEVNSKNGYGAYGGYKRFMATNQHAVYLENEGRVRAPDRNAQAPVADTEEIDLFIASVEAKTERLKSINAMHEAGKRPTQRPLSDSEAMEIARARRFEQQWTEQCG